MLEVFEGVLVLEGVRFASWEVDDLLPIGLEGSVTYSQAAALLSVAVEEVAALVEAGRLTFVLEDEPLLYAREVAELVEELRVERARARNTPRSPRCSRPARSPRS